VRRAAPSNACRAGFQPAFGRGEGSRDSESPLLESVLSATVT
jgi:hypothetical protein